MGIGAGAEAVGAGVATGVATGGAVTTVLGRVLSRCKIETAAAAPPARTAATKNSSTLANLFILALPLRPDSGVRGNPGSRPIFAIA